MASVSKVHRILADFENGLYEAENSSKNYFETNSSAQEADGDAQ